MATSGSEREATIKKQRDPVIAACGHWSKRSSVECANCAGRRYYKNNRKKVLEYNAERLSKGGEHVRQQRREAVKRYRDKYSLRKPDGLRELHRACKRLEEALAYAAKRERTGRPDE